MSRYEHSTQGNRLRGIAVMTLQGLIPSHHSSQIITPQEQKASQKSEPLLVSGTALVSGKRRKEH